MHKKLKTLIVCITIAVGSILIFLAVVSSFQGVPEAYWSKFETASVRFDHYHIPTIEARSWKSVLKAQGFVVASERLFQMDLLRRKAGGRLAEWFGEVAYKHDIEKVSEDRLRVAQRAVEVMPPEERAFCDSYSEGVNQFISEFSWRWGLEYLLLSTRPEPWTCSDSMLVLLEMADYLTSSATIDAKQWRWRSNLSDSWREWLFPNDHPWNQPMFGIPGSVKPPPVDAYLPRRPITADEFANISREFVDGVALGSNSWAYAGISGAFLANDPHLAQSVPGVWFASRLKVSRNEWVAGVTIPGIPAIVIGMNPTIAWSFTNTGEDVDDFLREKISHDRKKYLAKSDAVSEQWREIERKKFLIKVKGESNPRIVDALFTHRGPLAKRAYLGDEYFSRQWLPLKEGTLRLPTVAFLKSRSVDDLHAAVDQMTVPAQNVLFMTNSGQMGYRVSGMGVIRSVSGLQINDALVGEWKGFESVQSRRRKIMNFEAGESKFLATANERIWVDRFGHHWWSEDRKERIASFLRSSPIYARQDMERLQLDNQSRFRRLLVRWVAEKARVDNTELQKLLMSWRGWDGSSRSDSVLFTQSQLIENDLVNLLVGRVRRAFLNADAEEAPYVSWLRRAWIISALEQKTSDGFAPFGLTDEELATFLFNRAAKRHVLPHQDQNRWRAQHPFADKIPMLGRLFVIAEPEQWGAMDVVDASQPNYGPSMRVVWDMRKPWQSTWAFPVGQSGHALSKYYSNLQSFWVRGETYPVFPDPEAWDFGGSIQ